jgi:predicted RNase H-like HicB family nuclease
MVEPMSDKDEKSSYVAHVERDEAGYWIADIPAVPGAHTFAKRLDQLPGRLAEAIAVILELNEPVGEPRLDVRLNPELDHLVHVAKERRHQVDAIATEASEATRLAVRALLERGLSLRDAGAVLGISHQRIGQLIKS